MTVAELIAKLEKLPPDMPVMHGCDWDVSVDEVTVRAEVSDNDRLVNPEWPEPPFVVLW